MKTKNIFRIFLLAAVIGIAITSCQKDETTDPGTNGSDRDKFLGTWKVAASDSLGTLHWQMTISASNTSTDGILIKDFDAQTGTTTLASVSGNNFTIPNQSIGETVYGSGTYNSGTLNFHYYADDGQSIDNVTATATR